jgi:hypothetical protein
MLSADFDAFRKRAIDAHERNLAYWRERDRQSQEDFRQWCREQEERQRQERMLRAVEANRPMGFVGTTLAIALGSWIARRLGR